MQQASGIRVGDTVRVLRKAEAHEMGWQNSWSRDTMDNAVGKTLPVIATTHDIKLGDEARGYGFPFFVLELVKPKPVIVELNDRYAAEVKREGVQVGCQTFTHEKILELAEAVRQMKPKE